MGAIVNELLMDVAERVATLTLNRPERRNALNTVLLTQISDAMAEVDGDEAVDVIVLTGADPAFCAGLDLRELGESGDNLGSAPETGWSTSWTPTTKPVIAAVNGACVTGGLEIALQCDLRLASDRAVFADTHTHVGVVPAWGMTVLLPAAVGMQRATYLSLTGEFLPAEAAREAGLVLEVVPHADLLSRARQIATAMTAADQDVLRRVLATQRAVALSTRAEGLRLEATASAAHRADGFDPSTVAARRQAVIERGRAKAR